MDSRDILTRGAIGCNGLLLSVSSPTPFLQMVEVLIKGEFRSVGNIPVVVGQNRLRWKSFPNFDIPTAGGGRGTKAIFNLALSLAGRPGWL